MTKSQDSLEYAIMLFRAGQLKDAAKLAQRISNREKRNFEALYLLGTAEMHLGELTAAAAHLSRAARLKPGAADVWAVRGNVLVALGDFEEALASFAEAVKAKPDFCEVHYNRGKLLKELGRTEEALASYEQALAIQPRFADALANRGNLLMVLGRYAEAIDAFAKLCQLEPDFEYALGNLIHAKQQICSWQGLEPMLVQLALGLAAGKPVASPWMLVAATADPSLQRRCAEGVVARKFPATANPLSRGTRYAHERIRIAYVSADFYDHATMHLMAGLFERHDRSRFEIVAFSFGPNVVDPMRRRLEPAFDRFIVAAQKTDDEIASDIRALEIDIAVDLKGFTRDSRTGIFARRPAPVQVNYLGHPGTMGAPYIDYIIADRCVIPEQHKAFYSEKIVYLPDSYQANDNTRRIAETVPSRSEAGLPADGFVFCSFNRSYKITPELFSLWMRLLERTPGSVLWLFETNEAASANLRSEAARCGIEPERLVFAQRLPPEHHLARHRLADLFLDTIPCNAHTTASDALWAGLPVLSCVGTTFAGRVSMSLLHAVGLGELVTRSLEEYEALALALTHDRDRLAQLKAKLAANNRSAPLFDTEGITHHLEAAYTKMWDIQQRGEPPASFSIE
jgi:protein O-GlcNAc transferase